MARSITCTGGGPRDRIQVSYGYGLFTGGLGVHYGAELVGATVVGFGEYQTPDSSNEGFWDYHPRVYTILRFIWQRPPRRMGIDLRTLPLKIGSLARNLGPNRCAGD